MAQSSVRRLLRRDSVPVRVEEVEGVEEVESVGMERNGLGLARDKAVEETVERVWRDGERGEEGEEKRERVGEVCGGASTGFREGAMKSGWGGRGG